MQPTNVYRQLRAPRLDGEALIEPRWSDWPDAARRNRRYLATSSTQILGRPLNELAAAARRELIRQSADYTARYRAGVSYGESRENTQRPAIVMAGHQPQLFHPGVWFKNFALARLAQRVGAVAVNLVIDSDVCRDTSISVPTASARDLQVAQIAFDTATIDIPFEERDVCDNQAFGTFAEQAMSTIETLIAEPLVEEFWPLVRERHAAERNLGSALAQGRHLIESQWQLSAGMRPTLELPQSAVCRLPQFRWYVAHVLANLAEFASRHNVALANYRRAHRTRSPSRPVPDLIVRDQWQEAPFWVWSTDQPIRRKLFARTEDGHVTLTDHHDFTHILRLSADGAGDDAVEQLAALENQGIKLRTRALTTTLFARLFLCDWFIHGIGGAKYDEVTDEIIRGFYGLDPPGYGVVSATLRLPIPQPSNQSTDDRSILHALRDLRFNPDRWIDDRELSESQLSRVRALRADKQRWIATLKTSANAKSRHDAIAAVNEALGPYVRARETALREELSRIHEEQRSCGVRASREYAFCLFPKTVLQSLLLDSWQSVP